MSEEKKEFNCKQLNRLPVVNEWQKVYCPACGHYCQGKCENPKRSSEDDPCPFDGKPLPVVEVVS
jgi:uncharacterized paraquat-inducible protein A